MYLVHNATQLDLDNSLEGNTSIVSLDGEYRVLTPVNNYTFSNGVYLEPEEAKIFGTGRKCVNWTQLEENVIDIVLEHEKNYGLNIIKTFQQENPSMGASDSLAFMQELSDLKMALDDGFLEMAKYIVDNKTVNAIFTQQVKEWFQSKINNYFVKFPR